MYRHAVKSADRRGFHHPHLCLKLRWRDVLGQCELSYKSFVTLYSQQTVVVFIIPIIPLIKMHGGNSCGLKRVN